MLRITWCGRRIEQRGEGIPLAVFFFCSPWLLMVRHPCHYHRTSLWKVNMASGTYLWWSKYNQACLSLADTGNCSYNIFYFIFRLLLRFLFIGFWAKISLLCDSQSNLTNKINKSRIVMYCVRAYVCRYGCMCVCLSHKSLSMVRSRLRRRRRPMKFRMCKMVNLCDKEDI